MALLGAPRLRLRLCGRVLKRCWPPVAVRALSDRVLPKAATPGAPDTVSDHLLYTPEHLALKESLRKVRRRAANFDSTVEKTDIKYFILIHSRASVSPTIKEAHYAFSNLFIYLIL